MDIKELKQLHADLANIIQSAICAFESETGTRVTGIDLNRIPVGTLDQPAQTILNVDVRVEL